MNPIVFPSLLWTLAVAANVYDLNPAHWLGGGLDLSVDAGAALLRVLLWISTTFLVIRLVGRFLTRTALPRFGDQGAPQMIITLFTLAAWGFCLVGIVTVVYGQSISSLVTASSVMVAVIGFSLRGMISDLFYGLAIVFERPFEPGDWVQVNSLSNMTVGRVVDISWRATHLETREQVAVVVPHTLLATSQFQNLNRPRPYFRDAITIHLGYDITGHQAERLLLSAVEQVPRSSAIPEKPEARIIDFDERGVVWELRFWVPDFPASSSTAHEVRRALLRNLHFAGISVPRERKEVYVEPLKTRRELEVQEIRNWLARIDLFAGMSPGELDRLSDQSVRRLFLAGEAVVRQGEAGESMFVLIEGAMQVSIAIGEEPPLVVAVLRPGDFFGEMSLMTGATRAATVMATVDSQVNEINKEMLAPLIASNPRILEQITRVLAFRQTLNQRKGQEGLTEESVEVSRSALKSLLKRVTDFFAT